jgi:DNA-binding GntR family transcriptional regulator
MKQLSAAAVERAMKLQDVMLRGNGQTDHVVSGSRDPRHQLPAEIDMERYFKVTAPSVHQMIVNLEKRGFISRTPGQGRSIELRLSKEQLPDLE